MSRFNTGNPLGSGSPLDLDDNAKNMDLAVNSDGDTFQDRLGRSRLTWAGIEKAGSGDPAIAVDAAARAVGAASRAETAADSVERNAEQIAADAAQQAVQDVVAGVDGAVDRAESAADAAQAAADAAFINADVYATVAEGRAAVEIGDQFQVLSADGKEYVRYRKDSISTQTEVARVLSPNGTLGAIDFQVPLSPPRLWDGRYERASLAIGAGIYQSSSTGRLALVKIVPGVEYSVSKPLSIGNRFSISEFSEVPQHGSTPVRVVHNNINGVGTNTGEHFTSIIFTASPNANYAAIYVSNEGDEPPLAVRQGGFNRATYNEREFDFDVLSKNIVRGKNLFNGRYINRALVDNGASGEAAAAVALGVSDGASAWLDLTPFTTYTLSVDGGDRFRFALFKGTNDEGTLPSISRGCRILHSSTDGNNVKTFTFTTGAGEVIGLAYLTSNVADRGYPAFVQLEEGEQATSFETFGFKFQPAALPRAVQAANGGYGYGGVGNANFLSKDPLTPGAWADEAYTIPAEDDTATLQELFDQASGIVSLEPGKKYKTSAPIIADISKAKYINGNMAHIVVTGDYEAIRWVGTLTSSADATIMNRSLAYNEMSPMITGLRVTHPLEVFGTGLVVQGCMSPIVFGCCFQYLRRGIALRGRNRNVIIGSCNIYACRDYGIHFEPGGNLHQINIFGSHISYCKINIFGDDHEIFNIQITGNDIETSSYPEDVECNIYFRQPNRFLEDLELVGNTIECHGSTTKMIRIEGNPLTTTNASCITIAANVTGNSGGAVIVIGGASGVDISGQFKNNAWQVCNVTGNIDGLRLSVQSHKTGGGLFRAVGEYDLTDVSVFGCNLSGQASIGSSIMVDVKSLDRCKFSDNELRAAYAAASIAAISVKSEVMSLVRVDDNTIAVPDTSQPLAKAIEVIASVSSAKGSMCGNMSSSGTYTAPESFDVGRNL